MAKTKVIAVANQKGGVGKSTTVYNLGAGLAIGTAAVIGDVNWVMVASASVLAGVLSLLTSVAGLPELKE